MKKEFYVTPSVELIDCMVEQGFAASFGEDNQAGDTLVEDEWSEF